ncbi:tRNA (N(6)-L-threonylcarbamoyladenosine(37)-C(2))-methylthiotransferase [Candidatus Woesearchaeota archaeon]|nr:MAG: tRNA (N(6)-L-threonylcarbamoyladenosine(37)-C(2))-methylthiotransferase [Candidatus Woesearchaeota archaeon]
MKGKVKSIERVHIKSYGCSANQNDGEIMAGILERAGYIVVNDESLADAVIVNTCIVKGQTETHMKRILKELEDKGFGERTVVAGCMPEVEEEEIERIIPEASVISTHHIRRIADVVRGLQEGRKSILTGYKVPNQNDHEKAGLPVKSRSKAVGIIQINDGCTGYCTYCIVKKVKPVLRSYSMRKIVKTAESFIKNGTREIWLTSQDTGAYGIEREGKSQLPELLKEIVKIPGRFRIRVGMMNPDNIMENLDELVEAFSHEKVFSFLHLPVQSGSNSVLKRMARRYTAEEFEQIVSRFREKIPDLTLSTDIIVGFPGETEEEFEETMKLIQRVKPAVLNLSRFTPRPGTKAASMKQLPGGTVKDRSRKVAKEFEEIARKESEKNIGRIQEVLLDETGKPGTIIGRNNAYKQVVIKGENLKSSVMLGKFVKARITKAHPHYLEGEIVEE